MIEKRVSELESEFVIWSNILDDELMRYNSFAGSYSKEYLSEENKYFCELLSELDKKNEKYLCLVKAKWAHPNFEKCSWRLNTLLDVIYGVIESRKKH